MAYHFKAPSVGTHYIVKVNACDPDVKQDEYIYCPTLKDARFVARNKLTYSNRITILKPVEFFRNSK